MQCKSITSENYCKTKLYTSETDFLYVKSNKMYSCVIVLLPKIEHYYIYVFFY